MPTDNTFLRTVGMQNSDDTPLVEAINSRNVYRVMLQLQQGANVNQIDASGLAPIFQAIQTRNMDIVTLLVMSGADVNCNPALVRSMLSEAAGSGSTEIVDLLLVSGVDVNMTHEDGTALCHAAACGSVSVAELLLRHGADVTLHTPLCFATRRRDNKAMVELLLAHGADVNVICNEDSPLCDAIWRKEFDLALLLLNNGASFEVDLPLCSNAVLTAIAEQYVHIRTPNWHFFRILERIVANCKSFQYGVITLFNITGDTTCNQQSQSFSWGDDPRSCLMLFLNEVKLNPKWLRLCRLLLRHGVTEIFSDILEVVVALGHVPTPESDFYSESFLRLMILAGVDFRDWQQVLDKLNDMSLYEAYLDMVDETINRPRSLQDCCVMTVRRTLSAGGQLWSKIDSLPVTSAAMDRLKLLVY